MTNTLAAAVYELRGEGTPNGVYTSDIDGNVCEPGVYGWTKN